MHEASDLSMSSVVSSCSAPSTTSTDLASASLGAIVSGPQGDRNPEGGQGPMPKQVSDSELRVLQSCLRRWREEVESDVRGEAFCLKKTKMGWNYLAERRIKLRCGHHQLKAVKTKFWYFYFEMQLFDRMGFYFLFWGRIIWLRGAACYKVTLPSS